MPKGENISSIVLAGGQGTRLFPLTEARCKPAMFFAGRYRLIDIPISNSLHSNIKQIFVITQHLPELLHQHIKENFPPNRADYNIKILSSANQEKLYYGTADAVRKNLDSLKKTDSEYFLILSGDQLYHMDFEKMLTFAKKTDADLVIATIPIQANDTNRLGLLKVDEQLNVIDFFEKPTEPEIVKRFELPSILSDPQTSSPSYLGSMGIYIFKRNALFSLLEEKGNDFGKNLIPIQMKKGKTSAYIYDGYWEDIGTIESFYNANLEFTKETHRLILGNKKKPLFLLKRYIPETKIINSSITDCLINPGSIIKNAILSNSIIGVGSHIDDGTHISDSIVVGNHDFLQFHVIGKRCTIHKAILDEDIVLGDDVKLINKKNLTKYDGKGIFIRDGIIIVTKGTIVPSGFEL